MILPLSPLARPLWRGTPNFSGNSVCIRAIGLISILQKYKSLISLEEFLQYKRDFSKKNLKLMQKTANMFLILILSICFASCVHTSDTSRILDQAQERLDANPDSAFVALDSLDRRHLNTKELRARHALLYSIALEKCGIIMTNDSIINIAVDYYSNNGSGNAEEALQWRERIRANSQLLSSTDTLKRQQGRIIQERYADKMKLIVHRRSIWLLILLSSTVLLICLATIRRFSIRLAGKPDDGAMVLIRHRLAVLDKVLASYI